MDTPGPTPRRRRGRRAGPRVRIVSALVAVCAMVVAVSAFAVSELTLQAQRDHQVVQGALAAQGYVASHAPSLPETRADHLQMRMDGRSGLTGEDSVSPANRLMRMLMPAGVVMGLALAFALGREVVSAAREALFRG